MNNEDYQLDFLSSTFVFYISVENYKLICQDRSYQLTDWQVKSCHVSVTAYPTVYMTPQKDDAWKMVVQDVLKDVVKVGGQTSCQSVVMSA